MRTLRILLLLLTGAALSVAQGGTPFDCSFGATFDAAVTGTAYTNTFSNCVSWRATLTSTGFSAISIQIETSPDNSSWTAVTNTVCSSTVQPPCVIDGSNPDTTTGSSTFAVRAYGRYVRLNVTSVTGSGSISVTVLGYKGLSAQAGTSSGGGGTPTAPGSPILSVQYNADGTNFGGFSFGSLTGGTPASSIQRPAMCISDTVSSTALTAAALSQEIASTLPTALTGDFMFTEAYIQETTQFASATSTALTVSMGRPGATDAELLPAIPLMQATAPQNFWYDRPNPPLLGVANTYAIVLNFTGDGTHNVNTFSAGQVRWLVCGFFTGL